MRKCNRRYYYTKVVNNYFFYLSSMKEEGIQPVRHQDIMSRRMIECQKEQQPITAAKKRRDIIILVEESCNHRVTGRSGMGPQEVWKELSKEDNLKEIVKLVRAFINRFRDLIQVSLFTEDTDDLINEVLIRLHPMLCNPSYADMPFSIRVKILTGRILTTMFREMKQQKDRTWIPIDRGDSDEDPFNKAVEEHQVREGCKNDETEEKLSSFMEKNIKKIFILFSMFNALTEAQASVFHLHFIQKKKFTDIADELGKKVSATKAYIYDKKSGAIVKIWAELSRIDIHSLEDVVDATSEDLEALLKKKKLLHEDTGERLSTHR